ncbi:MAG: protein kinase [Planctomycetota bacterium]
MLRLGSSRWLDHVGEDGAERQAAYRAIGVDVNIFDVVGGLADGPLCFALESISGRPITKHASDLSLEARLELMHKVCLGVQHLRQKGVVHRDIQTLYVLVIDVDGSPESCIIDCGIPKLVEPDERALAQAPEPLVGAPASMSPEQLTSPGSVDTRSNVYTVDVLLYQVLTGELPLERERLRGTSLGGIAFALRTETRNHRVVAEFE